MKRPLTTLLILVSLVMAGCDGSSPAAGPAVKAREVKEPAAPTPRNQPRRGAAAPREITFDDIMLEMEKGSPFTRDLLPKLVTALVGEPIRIRCYILPSFQQTGLTQFVLVRDNQDCCFGPNLRYATVLWDHRCRVLRYLLHRLVRQEHTCTF